MLAAIAERIVTSAQLGADFYCYRPAVPRALLSFKRAPFQSSLPHLVCVTASDGALEASLAAGVLPASTLLLLWLPGTLISPVLLCQIS